MSALLLLWLQQPEENCWDNICAVSQCTQTVISSVCVCVCVWVPLLFRKSHALNCTFVTSLFALKAQITLSSSVRSKMQVDFLAYFKPC